MDLREIRSLVAAVPRWYHRIELAPGVVTPGAHDSPAELRDLDSLGLPLDCSGLRALDVGCSDGFFAFELERRGAQVLGLDYRDPESKGFAVAARVLGSRVEHLVANVYELDAETHGRFDLVLFLGVLYHLRNPMLALDRIRTVQEEGGLLFVETQLAAEPALASAPEPVWRFSPRDSLHGDATNQWIPNLPGLRAVLEECQYRVLETRAHGARGYARARAVGDSELEYFRRLDGGRLIGGDLAPDR